MRHLFLDHVGGVQCYKINKKKQKLEFYIQLQFYNGTLYLILSFFFDNTANIMGWT